MSPNQPKTPGRSVRIPDDEWSALKERSAQEGKPVSALILEAIRAFLKRK